MRVTFLAGAAIGASVAGLCVADIVVDPDGVGASDVLGSDGVPLVNPVADPLTVTALTIGRTGAGALGVDGGSSLTVRTATGGGTVLMGVGFGSTGLLSVSGVGSSVDVFNIGASAAGDVAIEVIDGATMNVRGQTRIGLGTGRFTSFRVAGAGSSVYSQDMAVSQGGRARVLVEDGGLLETGRTVNTGLFIGSFGAGEGAGEVVVRGGGSRVEAGAVLRIGQPGGASFGDGALVIESGGVVTAADIDITSRGTLRFGISGTDPLSGVGKLSGGIVRIDSAAVLELAFLDGFSASWGDSFDLIDGPIAGTFGSIDAAALSGGLQWDFSELYTTGVVRVVPGPGGFVALAAGCLVCARRRR